MDVEYSSDDSLRWLRVQAVKVQRFIWREGMWHGGERVRLNLRNVLVAVNVSLKMTRVCAGMRMHARVWDELLSATRAHESDEAPAVQMCLSLSPTWNTGNSLFDHYLPVSLSSTGTACYDCWCAPLTGQKHTRKLKCVNKIMLWAWLVPEFRLDPEEV